MIQDFVDRFMASKDKLAAKFSEKHVDSYKDVVKAVVEVITDEGYDSPDPERIHVIDDGAYQGTLLFVIAGKEYQPSNYWYVFVSYGSCSHCDTLQSIHDYGDEKPTEDQVSKYLTLALHIVQGLKKLN